MDRIEFINEQFEQLFKNIALPVLLSGDVWKVMARAENPDKCPDRIHLPFGYRPPEWNEHDQVYVVFYSADIINDTARDQDDGRFSTYVATVVAHLQYHIILVDEVPPDRIEHAIDETLYDLAPGSLALMNDVQMAYLDRVQEH